MLIPTPLLALLLPALQGAGPGDCLADGYLQTIVAGDLDVVYSELVHTSNGSFSQTSNIYVLRGASSGSGTLVWIFGSGYGDPLGDVYEYRQHKVDASHFASFDVDHVDEAITGDFGLARGEVKIRFITPHGHLDHVNQEFFTALHDLGYTIDRIFVHAADLELATCNLGPCCNSPTACDPDNELFGSPYDPPWTNATLALVRTIGAAGDGCSTLVKSFATAGLGQAQVICDPMHTPGTVDLLLPDVDIFIRGANRSHSCFTDTQLENDGWTVFYIHNCN